MDFWQHFYCACAISELPAGIMTTPFDSATPISYNTGILRQSECIFSSYLYFAARNSPYFYFRSTRPSFVKSGSRVPLRKGIISRKFEGERTPNPLPSYEAFTASMLRYIVTLMIDLLTLNGCRDFTSRVLTFHQLCAS